MLGSWSFGDYWKQEACRQAWSLVTDGFHLEKEKLFVTYFGGFRELEPDLETRDIWRQLGVSDERIIALGDGRQFLGDGSHWSLWSLH